MAKLLPPIVEGVIPAFYAQGGMVEITIPFTMNRAVNKESVIGIAIKIKTLQSSSPLCKVIEEKQNFNLGINSFVTFSCNYQYFTKRQSYKFQIAYIDGTGEVGVYSNVAIGKYTSKPSISIAGLNSGVTNYHSYAYSGIYKNEDYTENVASYCFTLTDSNGVIKFTTGELIHNSLNDNLTESVDICTIPQDLGEGTFYLQYQVITTNNLVLTTEKYALKKAFNISMDIKEPILSAVADNDNGCISLSLKSKYQSPQNINGNFIIYRSDEDGEYLNWTECYYFSLNDNYINKLDFWKDYTVEHKKQYKYAIAQFNSNGLYSEKVYAEDDQPVSIDFEDVFLFDGQKQLKLKYNAKISSFKNTTLEAKMETLGKQHPFIFRNSIVSYKEFPISGLITYLIDVNNTNVQRDSNKTEIVSEITTNLTSENIYKERQFKLDTLAWLTNGKPKLFRSPTEGNYIVRLLNVSLTPNDQLGRMLHTFNCTAYEIATPSYENLNSLNILGFNDISSRQVTQWKTIDLSQYKYKEYQNYDNKNILKHYATTIRLYDMEPGQQLTITFDNNHVQTIVIGSTGMYRLENEKYTIKSIVLKENKTKSFKGYLTYSFIEELENDFRDFNDIEILSTPIQQFIGENDIVHRLLTVPSSNGQGYIRNSKIDIVSIPYIRCYQRPIKVLRFWRDRYYEHNGIMENMLQVKDFNTETLYVIIENNQIKDYSIYNGQMISLVPTNLSGEERKSYLINFEQHLFDIEIGKSIISIKDSYDFEEAFDNLNAFMDTSIDALNFKIGHGVIAEVSHIIKSQTYILESNDQYSIKEKKNNYTKAIEELNALYEEKIDNNTTDETKQKWNEDIIIKRANIEECYNIYINTLEQELYAQSITEATHKSGGE